MARATNCAKEQIQWDDEVEGNNLIVGVTILFDIWWNSGSY